MDFDQIVQKICLYALPIILAITVHEAAHAYAAKRYGDPTAYMLGRMTLNPLKHIDPIGTVVVPLICLLAPGGFMFGWAKPVPVNFGGLNNPKADMVKVAAAGPLANLAMAVVWAFLYQFSLAHPNGYFSTPLKLMAGGGVFINSALMVLNSLPIPPLDGGRIAVGLLPHKQALLLSRVEPYGMFILIGLFATNLLGAILLPLVNLSIGLISLLVSVFV